MRLSSLLGAAAVALVASFATANAQQPQGVRIGVLECQGGQNVGMVVASATTLECVFRSEGRRPEPYLAHVTRFGVDLGVTENTGLAWAVHAPTRRIGRGDLAGNYGGVGGNVSFGVGGGGNLLWGGSQNSFALQPLSLQGQTGVNVSGGVVGLDLEPVTFQRGKKRHHHRRHH
ncbi:DUF992 domain-containing protein [Afipia clevelandensis]|uniref:DUF992 domain-containing protein n=1 Tax=Afipia clevelandensis ATCC 49720 TaxID=883079 RepID=K8P1Y3_9BRAD|nr:DUF992 domain-containing protein [Afipia clevelandensis]EGP10154.1 protein of unknown function DUF992 [Bradyrhizobiaceae bacterium SG-6C]EKS35466.1 hypothetical protein HMPREF9696_02301 [Afipia clevelandensis ATCC 49720]